MPGPPRSGSGAVAPSWAASGDAPPSPVFGVTVDRIAHVEELAESLAALPQRPPTRIYLDVHEPAGYHLAAAARIHGVSGVMGELLDSSDEKAISVQGMRARAREHVANEFGPDNCGDGSGEALSARPVAA